MATYLHSKHMLSNPTVFHGLHIPRVRRRPFSSLQVYPALSVKQRSSTNYSFDDDQSNDVIPQGVDSTEFYREILSILSPVYPADFVYSRCRMLGYGHLPPAVPNAPEHFSLPTYLPSR